MSNKDIRLYARGSGVPMWKLASYLKISEPTLTRRMRVELSPEEKKNYCKLIDEIKEDSAS